MRKHKGIFITFEGIDGCGKSTQAEKAQCWLKNHRLSPLFIREPGGTPVSEGIRKILLNRNLEIDAVTELFLYEAARAQLVIEKIIPALDKNRIIICDRFFDSTTAYQGYGRKLDLSLIGKLNRFASFGIVPDITFIFDVDYKTSLTRRDKIADRLEKEKRAFFSRVRRGFIELAGRRRVVLIDGRADVETVFLQVKKTLKRRLKSRQIENA